MSRLGRLGIPRGERNGAAKSAGTCGATGPYHERRQLSPKSVADGAGGVLQPSVAGCEYYRSGTAKIGKHEYDVLFTRGAEAFERVYEPSAARTAL
jgi:hypothetical protein